MKPFFSIVTVCLNAGSNLTKTIESVLNQNFKNFEIIIKDGFSSDDSYKNTPTNEKIIKIQKKDKGIYDAMNQALEFTNGQYILFLNAGDFFYDCTILESYHNVIINNQYPDLAYCDYKITRLNEYIQSPYKLTNFFLFRTMLCHQVCMIKRDVYNKFGYFNTKYKVDADYDFLLRLIIDNNGTYTHFQKLGIISTSGGFSSQNRELARQEVELIRRDHFPKKYIVYKLIISLTFPSLRSRLASGSGRCAMLYTKTVNIINRKGI